MTLQSKHSNPIDADPHISHILSWVASIWTAFPFWFLLFAYAGLGVDGKGVLKLVLSPFFWIIIVFAVMSGRALKKIKWYGWYLFVFTNILIAYQTATILTYYSEIDFKLYAFLATVTVQFLVLLLIGKQIRVPYYFPKIRWWESDPRYKLSVPVRIYKKDGMDLEGVIMDISLSGCFIKASAYFAQDEEIVLEFNLFDRLIKCSGKSVWRTESKVTHPKGIGVKFNPLQKETVTVLKKAQKRLAQLNRSYQQIAAERNWEEYLRREKRYQGNNPNDEKS